MGHLAKVGRANILKAQEGLFPLLGTTPGYDPPAATPITRAVLSLQTRC